MHEMSLAENILQIIEDARRDQGFSRLKTVVLEIGRLAAGEVRSMDRRCTAMMITGMCMRMARLIVIRMIWPIKMGTINNITL